MGGVGVEYPAFQQLYKKGQPAQSSAERSSR